MQHILFGGSANEAEIAILIKSSAFYKKSIQDHYINPLGVDSKYFIGFDLTYQKGNKCTAAHKKDYISGLLPEVDKLGIKNMLVCDAEYFKTLTKNTKADQFLGHIVPCAIESFEHINIILAPNYQAMKYNPKIKTKLAYSIETMSKHIKGQYSVPGTDIIKSGSYPDTVEAIRLTLDALHNYDTLTCDIEGLSLNFWNCGISTISFAWNKHEGVAFAVDRDPNNEFGQAPTEYRDEVRDLLKRFFSTYKGKLIYHGAGFDVKVMIFTLWMDHLADYKGMLEGLHLMHKSFDCSMIITYLATNNTVENVLGLKPLAQEFAGNYAVDLTDTSKVPINELLEYNLKDCLCTWYVHDKYLPTMIKDQQEKLYKELFKPSVKTLCQTELCGIPIDPIKVQEAKSKLTALVDRYSKIIFDSPIVKDYHFTQLHQWAAEYTAKAKKKVYTVDDEIINRNPFNPNSDVQLRGLLYDYLGYDVIDLTKGKKPATGKDTLEKLKANAKSPEHTVLIDAFVKLAEASKILTTFIPAFEKAQQLPDGSWRLYGSFKLGGTISLRLSSSDPNLMNLPSGSVFGKMIKACFVSTKDWIFLGSDFDALEDKVNTLQTRDPNKMKIYVDGYDGHCLRTYNYWPSKFPDIDPNSVTSINSIKYKYPDDRQTQKAPSFALQYQGTYLTLMNNCGFSEGEAKAIETNYHTMFAVADTWTADHIKKAQINGYVPLAFGGRLRTPILEQVKGKLTYMAQKEGRSAGNALTQSYCSMTLRAMNEFMERVWASRYKYLILPAITIHDAIYAAVQNRLHVVKWTNDNLVDCMAWNELPELQHDIIKISSAMDVHYLNWCNAITLPNNASEAEISKICRTYKKKYEFNKWVTYYE